MPLRGPVLALLFASTPGKRLTMFFISRVCFTARPPRKVCKQSKRMCKRQRLRKLFGSYAATSASTSILCAAHSRSMVFGVSVILPSPFTGSGRTAGRGRTRARPAPGAPRRSPPHQLPGRRCWQTITPCWFPICAAWACRPILKAATTRKRRRATSRR